MVCGIESAERLSAASQTLTDFVGVALRDYARNQKEKTTVGDLLFLCLLHEYTTAGKTLFHMYIRFVFS